MISSSYLWKIHKAGDIADQINELYDKKLNGKVTCLLVDFGEVTVDFAITYEEKRLKELLLDIQKGFKTDLGIE